MSNFLMMGSFLGVFIILFVIGLMIRFYNTKGSWRCKYDERQERIQGKGYRYGFYSMIVYLGLDYLIINLMEYQWAESNVDLALGIFLGVGVYAIYCIMNGAFISLNENPKRYAAVVLFVAVINGICAVKMLMEGEMLIRHGQLSVNCLNLVCAVFLFIILGFMALKHLMDKRESD